MKTPLVSVIVPNYNHEAFLKQRLETVVNQTFQDFEIILLDDASTDKSVDVLLNYKDHPKVTQLIVNSQNSGSPFKQWQKGITLAKGTHIWIAESDDYCELNFLEQIVSKLSENTDICYAQSLDVDAAGNAIQKRIQYTKIFNPNIWVQDFKQNGNTFIKNYLLVKNVIPNASAVVFKKGLIQKNTFDENLLAMRMCGDWLFWVRLCQNNKIAFISTTLNYFRNHPAVTRSHTTNAKKKQRLVEEAAVRRFVFKTFGWFLKEEEEKLYKKWFKTHELLEVVTSGFYQLKMPNKTTRKFVFEFLKHKIKIR